MIVVPYCAVEAAVPVSTPNEGIGDAQVSSIEAHGLRVFYSEVPGVHSDALTIQADALRFHAVVAAIFREAAVVQFRFPTTLEDIAALRDHIEQHAEEYRDFLSRVRDLVQMEIRLAGASSQRPSATGREYLLNRQAATAAEEKQANEVHAASKDLIREWKARKTQGAIRCYALVRRDEADRFRQRIESVLSSNPELQGRVSGPWPATEFFDVTAKP